MTVTPFRKQHFQTRREIYQLLLSAQKSFEQRKQAQVFSFSVEVAPIDPLWALTQLEQLDQVSFYFEKRDFTPEPYPPQGGMAIAAIGAVVQAHLAGDDRFQAAQRFIQQVLANTHLAGVSQLPLAGPHFFCGFHFFSEVPPGELGSTIFLPEWQVAWGDARYIVVANVLIDQEFAIESATERLWRTLQLLSAAPTERLQPTVRPNLLLEMQAVATTSRFEQSVQQALCAIEQGHLDKVVLAHAVDVRSPLPFHPIDCLQNLRGQYPDCYLFALNQGHGKFFLGASPERLVSLQKGYLCTDALAGSAPRGSTPCEDAQLANQLLHSQKEIHEHEVVRDFITHQLRQLQLSPRSFPLRLRQLTNIQHLHTPIQARAAAVPLLDVVAQLHPTPAVAGMPRAIACEQIRQHEAFERGHYAAPIGWVDHQGNGEFAVGIRSALVNGCNARLFAGAGIVAGSTPEQELAEVQLKLQALLHALSR